MITLYSELVRPRVARLLKVLKLDVVYTRAEGDLLEYATEAGVPTQAVDFLGGYGSTLLGHNHPEVVQAVRDCLDRKAPVHAQASVRGGAALLAGKLGELMARHGGDERRFVVTFANSGAEAIEAALKHALMEWEERRRRARSRASSPEEDARLAALSPVIVSLEGAFHGKTAGAVAVSGNAAFRSMYPSSPFRVAFLSPDDGPEAARRALEPFLAGGFSEVAAVLIEAIQGEGGVRPLPRAFAEELGRLAGEHGAPLVADEIQCGLFRAGRLVAAHGLGLRPDYLVFGKGLGGGLAKISALLVAEDRYVDEFGLVHTSTFAEDELSSRAALKALEVLDREAGAIAANAREFERRVREGAAAISARYPGILGEPRGEGFLLGLPFRFDDEPGPFPTVLHTIHQAGYASYVCASYLLHRHGLRVGVTLSRPDTLRLQPSAFVAPARVDRLLAALDDLCSVLHARKLVRLTAHFWGHALPERGIDAVSTLRYPPVRPSRPVPRVAFLSHIIDETHLRLIDPFLKAIDRPGRERFLEKLAPIAGPVVYHEQLVEGLGGRAVHLVCYGSFLPSAFFEGSHRAGDALARREVMAMAERARDEGAGFIGLGQYTSIVSANGTALGGLGPRVTTGNGLTAAFAAQGVERALETEGRRLADSHLGVVGAAGNIGAVVTQLLASRIAEGAGRLTLVFREGTEDSPRAREAVAAVLAESGLGPARVRIAGSLEALRGCDAVVLGTNAAEPLLLPEHLKADAVVMDVSVPSNIHPRVYEERSDVRCYLGGRAKLPLGQILRTDWMPAPRGETFACLGETICTGLAGYAGNLSYGRLTKEAAERALALARDVGMEMGSLRRVRRHERAVSVRPGEAVAGVGEQGPDPGRADPGGVPRP